jgi:dihydrofolate reductase
MTQRRIVMFNQVSADGFFSDSSGGLDWVVQDPELQQRAVAGVPETDTILLGRRTYESFAAFWPGVRWDLKSAGPHGENKADPAFLAMARWLNESKKLVASRTLLRPDWNNTELLPALTPQALLQLKQSPGKNVIIFGSGSVVSQLSEAQLIDEYRLVVCPVLLGSGHSLLRGVSLRLKLHLAEALPLRSGNVLLTYTTERQG